MTSFLNLVLVVLFTNLLKKVANCSRVINLPCKVSAKLLIAQLEPRSVSVSAYIHLLALSSLSSHILVSFHTRKPTHLVLRVNARFFHVLALGVVLALPRVDRFEFLRASQPSG